MLLSYLNRFLIEGNQEYNEQLIKRLHKVLRPFILRRLKVDVEKQMPKKYEHVVSCKLSKRQRLLYNEFMSLASTRATLAEGRYMSVINILMQLRKVCNHPDLFDPRPIVSSFAFEPMETGVPSLVFNLREEVFAERLNALYWLQPCLPLMETRYAAFDAHRAKHLQASHKLIEETMATAPHIPLKLTSYAAATTTTNQRDDTETTTVHSSGSYDLSRCFYDSKFEGLNLGENVWMQTRVKNELVARQTSYARTFQLASQRLRNKIHYLSRINYQRCNVFKPVYGTDLQNCIGKEQVMIRPLKVNFFFFFFSSSSSLSFDTKSKSSTFTNDELLRFVKSQF